MKPIILFMVSGFLLAGCHIQKASLNTTPIQKESQSTAVCTVEQFPENRNDGRINAGAVIVYERKGGTHCVDLLSTISPKGQILGENGMNRLEKQISSTEVDELLGKINDIGWFTDDFYSTWHLPCPVCYEYLITIKYQGQIKAVSAVEGGVDGPAEYWMVVGYLHEIIPHLPEENWDFGGIKFDNP